MQSNARSQKDGTAKRKQNNKGKAVEDVSIAEKRL